MKIKDYISKCIQEFPSLYKDVDYEKSKLKVLDSTFFTIGTGLELAETENPSEGGYVTYSKYKECKKTYEYIRVKDKPYGKQTYKSIPNGYFETDVYYVSCFEPLLETLYKKDTVYFRYKKNTGYFGTPKLYLAESTHSFRPYPFSKDYSIACKVFYEDLFLQDDWMNELIFLCEITLEFFNDESQYKNDGYYPNENDCLKDLKQFQDRFTEEGLKGLHDLQDIWGYEIKDTVPTIEEIQERKQQSWVKYHKKQIDFLTSFLTKYK